MCWHIVSAPLDWGRLVRILDVPNQRTTVFEWVAKLGQKLAEAIQSEAGQNSVACSIRSCLSPVAEVLRMELALTSDNQSVVRSGGSGYRFNEWITVRDAREAKPEVLQGKAVSPRLARTDPVATSRYWKSTVGRDRDQVGCCINAARYPLGGRRVQRIRGNKRKNLTMKYVFAINPGPGFHDSQYRKTSRKPIL